MDASRVDGTASGLTLPWAKREYPSQFSVEDTARRVGNYKWLEMRIFEMMGGWVALAPELEAKMQLGSHCYHHAFHAELWHKRLPELGELSQDRLTTAPNEAFETFVDAVSGPDLPNASPESTIERLSGMYRVLLPALIGAYTYHLNNTSSITDAPTMRALEMCLRDDMQEWRSGEMLLQSLLVDEETIDRAVVQQGVLSKLLLKSGGVCGPGSMGLNIQA